MLRGANAGSMRRPYPMATSAAPRRSPTPGSAAAASPVRQLKAMEGYRYCASAIQPHRPECADAASAPALPARSGAQRLPPALLSGIAQLSGIALDHVRVHYTSARPAQLHAHAYAQGSDIHVAPGQARHLPHEAWHLVQQAQGRVAATAQRRGTPMNEQPHLEREADAMGRRAQQLGMRLAATANTAVVTGATGLPPPSMAARAPASGIVQAKLTISKDVIQPDQVDALLARLPGLIVEPTLKQEYEAYLASDHARLAQVVGKWADAPAHSSGDSLVPAPTNALKAKMRSYDSVDSFVFAALSEAQAKQKKSDEKAYAMEIAEDPGILVDLVGLIQDAIPAALQLYGKSIDEVAALKPHNRRSYLEYVRRDQKTDIANVLRSPGSHTFGELVAAIHDVQELLYQAKNEELLAQYPKEEERNRHNIHALQPERYRGSVFLGMSADTPNGLPLLIRTPVQRAWRGKDATPRPTDPHVRTAMMLGNPSDMGPSMTAARMFVLATAGGADSARIHSLALALFAFWNRIYRRDITDVHRYHFTMDMAANFGVSYSPFTPIDAASRKKQQAFNLREVESEFDDWD